MEEGTHIILNISVNVTEIKKLTIFIIVLFVEICTKKRTNTKDLIHDDIIGGLTKE